MKVKSAARRFHDLHTSLIAHFGKTLVRRDQPPTNQLGSSEIVWPGGVAEHDNSLEHCLYNSSETVNHQWQDTPLYRLESVWCVGDQGNVFFQDGSFLGPGPTLERLASKKIRRPIKYLHKRITEPVFHLTGVSHENHGHFVLHHLPRLMAALELLQQNQEIRILCAKGHEKWQARYLARVGIDPKRIISTSDGTLNIAQLYYVPRYHGTFGLNDPDFYRQMRDAFVRPSLKTHPSSENKVPLFISRMDAPDKRLANEDELVSITKELLGDVRLVRLSDYNMDEQIQLFRSASIVIGALGQGLVNMIYTHDSVLLILDHRSGPRQQAGSVAMTRTLTTICGGKSSGIFALTKYYGKNRDWKFDPLIYREHLTKIKHYIPALEIPNQ